MKQSFIDIRIRIKSTNYFLAILLIISALYAVVCVPLYHLADTNVLFQDGILMLAVTELQNILNLVYYFTVFSFFLYAFLEDRIQYFAYYAVACAGVTLLRNLANTASGLIFMGDFTDLSAWGNELGHVAINVLAELILFAIALLVIWLRTRNKPPFARAMPISKLSDVKHPVAGTAMLLAIIPSSVHLITRLYYDIFDPVYGGLPTDGADLLWMVIGYASDFLTFVAGYFIIVLFVNHLFLRETKTKYEYEAAKDSLLK